MNARMEAAMRLAMATLFLMVGVIGAVLARDFSRVGQWFPFYTSLAIVVVSSIVLIREAFVSRRLLTDAPVGAPASVSATGSGPSVPASDALTDETDEPHPFSAALLWWAAVVVFAACVYVVGLFIAAPVFIFVALWFSAGVRWYYALLAAAIALGALWLLIHLLQLPLPEGVLG